MKLHSSKLGHFDFPGGKLAYAYSGNTRLAFSAIQKCRKKLESGVKNEVLREVEKIHDAEYRRKSSGTPITLGTEVPSHTTF